MQAVAMLGHWEIVLIILVILLLFGAKRLPELARSLGKSLNEFKKGREEGAKEESEQEKPAEEGSSVKPESNCCDAACSKGQGS